MRTHEVRRGSAAQRVAKMLETTYGIQVGSERDWLLLEIQTLWYMPNHIEGVIRQVLREDDRKIGRAREKGWGAYFWNPVLSLLASRDACHRNLLTKDIEVTDELVALYSLITATLLDVDMTADELLLLLLELPRMAPSQKDLHGAIRICKDRKARSVYYLMGILRRGEQWKETRTREILDARSEQAPWTPPVDHERIDDTTAERLSGRWQRIDQDITGENE